MLTNLQNHLYPTSINEVMELLQKPNSKLLAGGTGLSLETNEVVETLIDLQNVKLSYIEDKGEYFAIGAMTSAHTINTNENLPASLRFAANCVGDTPIMHAVTIGGNLAKFYYWVDLPPMLWALDASVVVYNPNETLMSADDFFEYSAKNNISARKELIAEIRVPKSGNRRFSEYQSFMTTENEKSQLNLASAFEWDENGIITSSRLVLGSAMGSPTRLTKIEEKITGSKLKDLNISDCVKLSSEYDLVSNFKSSIEYRKHILGIYLKRTLTKLKLEGAN